MKQTRLFRIVVLVTLGCAGAYLAACSSSKENSASSNPLTAGVLRQGGVTDAALTQVVTTEADDWGWAGGVFDAPLADSTTRVATISAAAPFTFTWHADSAEPSSEAGAASADNASPGSGLTGSAYFLVFSTQSSPQLLRVFTTNPTYTPDAATWKTLTAAPMPITVSLTTATFANDALTAEGGPHQGQALALTLAN